MEFYGSYDCLFLSPSNLSRNPPCLVKGKCEVLGRLQKPVIVADSGFASEDPWAHLETLLRLFVFLCKEVLEESRLGHGFASQIPSHSNQTSHPGLSDAIYTRLNCWLT